jgi:hypothetical protein
MVEPYHEVLAKASGNNPAIIETLNLLRTANESASYERLGQLLRTAGIQETLVALNAQIKTRYDIRLPVFEDGLGLMKKGQLEVEASASAAVLTPSASSPNPNNH